MTQATMKIGQMVHCQATILILGGKGAFPSIRVKCDGPFIAGRKQQSCHHVQRGLSACQAALVEEEKAIRASLAGFASANIKKSFKDSEFWHRMALSDSYNLDHRIALAGLACSKTCQAQAVLHGEDQVEDQAKLCRMFLD